MRGGGRPNTTGYIGVTKHERSRRWRASITLGLRPFYIGMYKTPLEAARAYDVVARKHGKVRLNFPELTKELGC